MGMEVYVPWPISTLCIMSVTHPARPMRTKALGAKASTLAAPALRVDAGRAILSNSPPPAAAPAAKTVRREKLHSRDAFVAASRAEEPDSSGNMLNLFVHGCRWTAQPA